jgi:hypothetical protein
MPPKTQPLTAKPRDSANLICGICLRALPGVAWHDGGSSRENSSLLFTGVVFSRISQ